MKLDFYFREAYRYASQQSQDPRTNVGAVLIESGWDRILLYGTNRFPDGVAVTEERQTRPTKYHYVVHAEQDAIYQAARRGIVTKGLWLVAPWSSCTMCARSIISAGITRLIRHAEAMEHTPTRWVKDIRRADEMLKEAGVTIQEESLKLGHCQSLISDEVWSP